MAEAGARVARLPFVLFGHQVVFGVRLTVSL
jgi:hypothetical protein